MSFPKNLRSAWLAVAAIALAACGGSGGGSGERVASVSSDVAAEEHIVVRYDLDGDALPDVLTLDPARDPLSVAAALRGTAAGDLVEAPELVGRQLDSAISDALKTYLAGSYEVGEETELDVVDSHGNQLTITVFE